MSQECIAKVNKWLDEVVIGENLCPFAKPVRQNDSIRLLALKAISPETLAISLRQECDYLQQHPATDTTLLILDGGVYSDYFVYLECLEQLQSCLIDWQLDTHFQLASFHPQYLFAEEDADATSHYTNRAPYPIVHILRESSVSEAVDSMKNPDEIYLRNIKHAEKLGAAFFKQYL